MGAGRARRARVPYRVGGVPPSREVGGACEFVRVYREIMREGDQEIVPVPMT